MVMYLDPPLSARDGRTLKVILPSRVSDLSPGKQDKRSLGDQEDIQRRWLAEHTDLPVDLTVLAGSGSGEILERAEYLRLLELIESGEYDLVLTEDLGRIVRRVYAFVVCELCEDHGVRLIAINNHNVDTAKPGWRDAAFFAAYFYEKDNNDKSVRLKERLRSRFIAGGALPGLIYGYNNPTKSTLDEDLRKDPGAEEIYKEWFRKLDEDDCTYAEIADWLNANKIPTGPSCWTKTEWDGPLVSDTTHNWLLKGIRFRNKRKSRRINKSGKYKSEAAPAKELLIRRVPGLAFFSEAYYDRVLAKIDGRNDKYRRADATGNDSLRGVPRKRTRFPGQSVCCGVCGRLYVFGGHGQKEHLMCSGAREYKCWNGITFEAQDACKLFTEAVYSEIENLPAFEPEFLEMLQEEVADLDTRRTRELRNLEGEQRRNAHELDNVSAAIRKAGDSQRLLADLKRLELEAVEISEKRRMVESGRGKEIHIPSIEEVKEIAREEFCRHTAQSQEFARLMRRLVPTIFVFPFRHFDGGIPFLRATLDFTASPLIPQAVQDLKVLIPRLSKLLRVDLFDPPQYEQYRLQVVAMRAAKIKEKDIAVELKITKTAAQRAAALQRKMNVIGLANPWLPLVEPPTDYPKMRRHLHSRYSYEPLEGFPREWPHS